MCVCVCLYVCVCTCVKHLASRFPVSLFLSLSLSEQLHGWKHHAVCVTFVLSLSLSLSLSPPHTHTHSNYMDGNTTLLVLLDKLEDKIDKEGLDALNSRRYFQMYDTV